MSDHTDAPCLTCDGTGVTDTDSELEETCRDCSGSGCDDECRECADEAVWDWHWEHYGRGPMRVGGGA